MKQKTSKSMSFAGFKISTNLKSAIKNSAYVLIPAILADLALNNLITTGLAGLIGTILLKTIEFYTKNIPLSE